MSVKKTRSRAGTPCKDHLGNEYRSLSAMARAYDIGYGTLIGRIRRGMPMEKALTMPKKTGPGQDCEDHLGNTYPSISAMTKAYGVSYTVYMYRIETCGWDKARALTTPATDTDTAGAHACVDHLGNRFPSKKAMCEHWHVPRNVYFIRKKAGKSLEECLSPVTRRNKSQTSTVKDHAGNEFMNLDEMCAHWGILKSEYTQNIRNNLPIARALTERTKRPDHPKDHLGTEYPSINAMCRAWNITKTVLRSRLELGWTLEEILTHPENNSHQISCRDHLGNEYPSQKAMLAAWNISCTVYKHRLSKGCTLAEALDPKSRHTVPATDHEGRSFPCLQAMLDYWMASTATYHHRTGKQGMDVKTALTTVLPVQSLWDVSVLDVFDSWYYVSDRSGRYVLSIGQLFSLARHDAMLDKIAGRDLPKEMRAKHVSGDWFQVWNTERTGPAPGMVMAADDAWLEYCRERYAPMKSSDDVPSAPEGADTARD